MNRLDTTISGGFRTSQKTWEFMQDNFLSAFSAIAKLCGDKTILTGVVVTGGSVSDGWISYNGELVYFEAGGTDTDVVVSETPETVTYEDLTTNDQYIVKTAKCGTGSGSFPFADLKRLPNLPTGWQTSAVTTGSTVFNGTITSVSRKWKIMGDTIVLQFAVAFSLANVATLYLRMPLPVDASSDQQTCPAIIDDATNLLTAVAFTDSGTHLIVSQSLSSLPIGSYTVAGQITYEMGV